MCARSLLALTAWACLAVSAQETMPAARARWLSLRDCFDLALGRNLDIQIEHLNTTIAHANLSGAYGAYIPTFSADARHEFVSQPGDFDSQKFNPDFPYELNADRIGSSLAGALPFGLSYDLSAFGREDNARTDFRGGNPNDVAVFPGGIRSTNNYFSDARLDLQQHLLRDFWIDADRERLLLNRKDLKISEQALRFQIMKTLLAVELSYYDLIAAREDVRVQEKTLELRQQLVAETRRRVEVGDLPPLDSDQAETQLQNTLTALTAAREALVTRQNGLKSLLTDNFRDWADVDLEPADALLAIQAELNRSAGFLSALKNRPDLIEARVAIEKSDVVVQYRKNQLFPTLDLVGRYGGLGVDTSPGTSFNDALSFYNQQYFYGVVVSFPLYNLKERSDYRASKAYKQIAQLQLKKAEDDVLLQVADFVNRAQSRFSQVASTRKARAYAEAALAAEQKKLQNGLSTSFVVLELQEVLTAARTAEVQAMVDYNKALAQLAFAEGATLERNHLTVDLK